ncbi:hypothetical protein C8034_v005377 [Colletotrichum sidae]|uniref:Uncharacterized protein n=1 Tax=Colletotrichum sidae TaxID=1347389 RepID=A0A4R8T6Y6_9PEZI|nr:hypothetical protein C8034_v005377 [Colletotrichum sidae]
MARNLLRTEHQESRTLISPTLAPVAKSRHQPRRRTKHAPGNLRPRTEHSTAFQLGTPTLAAYLVTLDHWLGLLAVADGNQAEPANGVYPIPSNAGEMSSTVSVVQDTISQTASSRLERPVSAAGSSGAESL